jgi:hypothetical protein
LFKEEMMSDEWLAVATSALHWGVGSLLAVAGVSFLIFCLIPAVSVGRRIRSAERSLSEIKLKGTVTDIDGLRVEVMQSDRLRHCWDEYRDTLHPQKRLTAQGAMEVVRWRATSMAGNFFTERVLVDTPLRADFFKHLPGILTGLGIIGTFTGLILGLQRFRVADDPNVVRTALESLIGSVGGAFIVSGIAIALAMLVTTIEKFVVSRRYADVERLCGLIDSLFDAGAGEEYLQRLVEAAETSATQAMQMKESLVTDLKQVLTELANQQMATVASSSEQLGRSISTSISDGLREPLERISGAVQAVSGSQGEAVNRLLTDVLANFSTQMEGLFGSQIKGMNEMLTQAAASIQVASTRFDELAVRVEHAGSSAAQAMADRVEAALQQMNTRQSEANDHMDAFIRQLQGSVAKGQADSAELTMNMMKELSDSSTQLIRALQQQASENQQGHVQRQDDLARQTTEMLDTQSLKLSELASVMDHASTSMADAVQQLQSSTARNLERMDSSAGRLQDAAGRLGDNLQAMKSAGDGMVGTAEKLNVASSAVQQAMLSSERILKDQQLARDGVAAMVSQLQATVDVARKDAGLAANVVQTLEAAAQSLSGAQKDAGEYLSGVSDVLAEAHGAFARQIEITLREGNSKFHEELAAATDRLRGAIQDLGEVLDNLPAPA